jgi:hypothetical protein
VTWLYLKTGLGSVIVGGLDFTIKKEVCAAGEFSTRMWEDLGAAGVLEKSWTSRAVGEAVVKDSAEMPKVGKSKKGEIQKPKRDMLKVSERVCTHWQSHTMG